MVPVSLAFRLALPGASGPPYSPPGPPGIQEGFIRPRGGRGGEAPPRTPAIGDWLGSPWGQPPPPRLSRIDKWAGKRRPVRCIKIQLNVKNYKDPAANWAGILFVRQSGPLARLWRAIWGGVTISARHPRAGRQSGSGGGCGLWPPPPPFRAGRPCLRGKCPLGHKNQFTRCL